MLLCFPPEAALFVCTVSPPQLTSYLIAVVPFVISACLPAWFLIFETLIYLFLLPSFLLVAGKLFQLARAEREAGKVRYRANGREKGKYKATTDTMLA